MSESEYFERLNQMLKNHGRAIPSLVVDLDILDSNIEKLKTTLATGIAFRLVVKSLPSIDLINYIMDRSGGQRLMVFHQPFLTDIARQGSDKVDVLMGKPMPISAAQYFFKSIEHSNSTFNPFTQIQWLVDTEHRIEQYIALAKTLGEKIRLNLEIDVGLHRGGFETIDRLSAGLELIKNNSANVEFSGLMGYDPHVAKVPSILRSRKKLLSQANTFYQKCQELIKSTFPSLWNDQLTFNGAGSPTIELHGQHSPLNDISAGSCLVKPTTFDLDTLEQFRPSAFIATPILKKLKGTIIPGLERMKGALSLLSSVNKQSFFIYGGFWKADYCYPKGIKSNTLFGESTNQTMVNGPSSVKLNVDDFIFLRPQQSEYVFLHFGKLLAVRNFEIVNEFLLLNNE